MSIFKKIQSPLLLKPIRIVKDRKYSSSSHQALAWSKMLLPRESARQARSSPASSLAPIMMSLSILVTAGLMMFKLFDLQVSAHDRYVDLANGNRVRESINYAPRGKIYDRNGKIIAQNTLTFQLSVTPFLLAVNESDRDDDYKLIATQLGEAWQNIKAQTEKNGLDYPLPIVVASSIEHDSAIKLMQFLPRLAGFDIGRVPTRQYIADAGLAHIIGYVGIVSEQDLAEDWASDLLPIDVVGKSGIELQYDDILRGNNGLERTEVDTLGRPVRLLAQHRPENGQDITLTIDLDIQRRLDKELKDQMIKAKVTRASAVAIDPETGEVLAMVSVPYYDNNLFAKGISVQEFSKLANDPDEPLVNKVISGGYTTGSTIKPMVASAALQEKVVTPDTIIVDTGAIAVTSIYQPGQQFIFRGWRPGGLGPMNIRSAIAWSSNIYFYTVGGGYGPIAGLGVDRLTAYYRDFGLGEKSGIDLPGEISGRVPDRAWKKEFKNEDWYVGDTYNISIGQGDLIVSPLQLMLGDMTVANNGYVLQPFILKKIADHDVGQRTVRREVGVSKDNLKIVREGMRQVLTNGTTCECTFSKVPVKVAGKSGTAQTTSDETRRSHAWFTAFAPYENPEVMITVMLEEGSGGSLYAAPVIAGAMETFFTSK
jgi:penicillin-binding protein 2